MPRQNREEFLAEIAAAKVEGFQVCSELVGRLADAGLSLKVAKYALGEAEGELIDEREAALEVAAKTRVPAEKPKKRRVRALADTPQPEPLPDGGLGAVDPPAPPEPELETLPGDHDTIPF